MTAASVCTPLRVERAALAGVLKAPVRRTGRGPARRVDLAGPVLVAGVAGALDSALRPGDIVVADELRTEGGRSDSLAAPLLYGALRRLGIAAHLGPLLSSRRLVDGAARAIAAESGAVAVDTESAFLAAQAPAGRTVALRAIVDTPAAPLLRLGTAARGITALRALRAAAPAIDQWVDAVGDREILICDATTNRQSAVRAIAPRCDVVLVVGSANSSNSCRLVEIAERHGTPAYSAEDATEVDLRWLSGVTRIGVTAGASAPPHLVDELLRCLSGLGRITVDEVNVVGEECNSN